MKKRLIIFGSIILFLPLFFILLNHTILKQYNESFDCFGTTCEITIFSKNPKAQKTLKQIALKYQKVEEERRKELENLQGKSGTIEVSSTLYDWVLQLQEYDLVWNHDSLIKLWKENLEKEQLPSNQALQKKVSSLQILSEGKVQTDSFDLNVDMIFSGWLADQIKKDIEEAGFFSYMMNLGGNVTVGKHYKDQFKIGLYKPITHTYFDTIEGDHHSVYSVGMSDSTIIQDIAYTPVIDLETRYPYSYYRSVTVVDEDPMKANLLSYVLFTLPLEEGKKLATEEKLENVIWIRQDETMEYLKEAK